MTSPRLHRSTLVCLRRLSDCDPLHLVERDLVTRAVVKLGGARAFVCGHGLGVLERAAGFEIGGDPGGAEDVATKFDLEAGIGRAPTNHAIGVDAAHWLVV